MPLPDTIAIDQLGEPFYTGSVQRLYGIPGADDYMVAETTSRGSVFDVGSIFEVPGSDVSRAVFRHMLYSKLEETATWDAVAARIEKDVELDGAYSKLLLEGLLQSLRKTGARTHHAGMIDRASGKVVTSGAPESPSAFNIVRRFQIMKPEVVDVLGGKLFDYSAFPHANGFVVPLEYIVRFGITGASSIYRYYQSLTDADRQNYERELGVSKPLEAWQMLDKPISDCTTKFEPEDRNLSRQEALTLCGLTGEQYRDSLKLAVLGAWAVRSVLEPIGLLLWDLKWEFAKDGDDLVFVDTIDTDSFRATRFVEHEGLKVVAHFNKQSIRDYYRIVHSDWINAVNAAKKRAKQEGVAFTELLKAGQASGTYPDTPQIDHSFLALQERKMTLIRDYMLGKESSEVVDAALLDCAREELAFYMGLGKMEAFLQLNGVVGS